MESGVLDPPGLIVDAAGMRRRRALLVLCASMAMGSRAWALGASGWCARGGLGARPSMAEARGSCDDGRTLGETDGWSPRPASHKFAYDALDRLRVAETMYLADDASRPHRQSWSHDFLGNMVEWRDEQNRFWDRSLGAITNGIDTAAADPPSALVSASLDAQNHLEATYTAAGDMETLSVTRGGATTLSAFAWDEVHRLTQATVAGRVSSFTYDYADTRRVKDGTRPDGTAERVRYAFDDFEVRDGEITKWVIVGSARVLRVTTRPAQADVAFYLSNHLGTTSVVIGADGAPVSASSYLPYGAIEAEVVSVPGFDPEYRFTGKERDDATGLDYFGARYYAANLGRWLSPDPPQVHEPEPEIPDGAYAYVANNPLIYRDPDGQVIETIADVVGLGVDVAEMVRDPSLANAGMLAWSLLAVAIPVLPGSWTLRAAKAGVRVAKAVKAARQADRVADAARAAHRADAAADVARGGNRVQEAAQQTKQAVQRTQQASKGGKVAPRRRGGGGGGGGGSAPRARGARRGPKTDPNAPHNATIRAEP